MKKKMKNIFKIFMALIIVFSQLSNATLVLAAEITNDDLNLDNGILSNQDVILDEEEDIIVDETGNEEGIVGEDNSGETDDSDSTIDDNDIELVKDNLELLMNIYLNGETIPDELRSLLVKYGIPSAQNEEFTEITFEDIMFINELLKNESNTETEGEENEYLKLELSDIPENVNVGDNFDVNIIISNEVAEDLLDDDGNLVVSDDFIDGIEGLIDVNDNLKVSKVIFNKFTGISNEEGKFVATGDEYGEDKGIVLTITFEALEEGVGEVTISGKLAKYLTISDFEKLSFTVNIIAKTIGLNSLESDVGQFDKEFSSEVTEYTLTVPEDATEINLSGLSLNSEDEVVGLGNYIVDSDNMIITILVTSSNGNKKEYTINVVRIINSSNEEDNEVIDNNTINSFVATPIVYYVYSSNSYLKSLSIKDYDIDFNKNTLEYKIKVKPNVNFIDITALAEDYRSRVEINGNENFGDGENVVTIKVTAEDGSEREYKLLVEKEVKKDKTVEKENTGKTEKIIIIILIILVVLGLLYLIFNNDDSENNDNIKEKNSDNSKKREER